MYAPLTKMSPASQYWGIDISSCMHGSNMMISTPIAGILDAGAPSVFALYACRDTYLFSFQTEVLIPDSFFRAYINAIPEAKFNKMTGLIEIPHSSMQHMQPLHFTIGDREFTLDVGSQLVPHKIYTALGGDATGKCYGVVGSIGHVMGHGLDFLLGIPFMEKYYTVSSGPCFEKSILNGHPWQVYDADRQQIGFAPAYVLVWWDFHNLNLSLRNKPLQNTLKKKATPESKSPCIQVSPTTSSDSA